MEEDGSAEPVSEPRRRVDGGTDLTEIDCLAQSHELFGVDPFTVFNNWTYSFWLQMMKSKTKLMQQQSSESPSSENVYNSEAAVLQSLMNIPGVKIN